MNEGGGGNQGFQVQVDQLTKSSTVRLDETELARSQLDGSSTPGAHDMERSRETDELHPTTGENFPHQGSSPGTSDLYLWSRKDERRSFEDLFSTLIEQKGAVPQNKGVSLGAEDRA